jgi:hypothetical protein
LLQVIVFAPQSFFTPPPQSTVQPFVGSHVAIRHDESAAQVTAQLWLSLQSRLQTEPEPHFRLHVVRGPMHFQSPKPFSACRLHVVFGGGPPWGSNPHVLLQCVPAWQSITQMSSSHPKRVLGSPLPLVARSVSAHVHPHPVHVLVWVSGAPPPPPVKETPFPHPFGDTFGVQVVDGSGRSFEVVPESVGGAVSSSPALPLDVEPPVELPDEEDDDLPPSLLLCAPP